MNQAALPVTEQRLADWLAALPDLPQAITPRILDLGCGVASSAVVMKHRWPAAHLIGIDLDGDTLRRTPRLITVLQADGQALPFRRAAFDLILMRHPDVFRLPPSWAVIIAAADQWLTPGGYLLLTCYSLPEAQRIRAWLPSGDPCRDQPIDLQSGATAIVDAAGHDRYVFARQSPNSTDKA